MGIHIDIYGITDYRNKEVIELFIAEFTDRSSVEDRGDEELMILNDTTHEQTASDDYTWIKAETLTKAIETGLADASTCFTLYLGSDQPEIEQAMISFTLDGKLILGLSIEAFADKDGTISNSPLAEKLAIRLQETFHCRKTYYETELPSAHTEAEFYTAWLRNKDIG